MKVSGSVFPHIVSVSRDTANFEDTVCGRTTRPIMVRTFKGTSVVIFRPVDGYLVRVMVCKGLLQLQRRSHFSNV